MKLVFTYATMPLRIWVVFKAWGWLVVPIGAPAIGYGEAAAIYVFSVVFHGANINTLKIDDLHKKIVPHDVAENWGSLVAVGVIVPLINLVVAWVVAQLVWP